ncbi:glycosyltransferase [Bifidobacterium sp. ESL0790]|uniref:glycosyltransferase n=1 Tax=Bifidobacterium sp. ESL0790 TaxID=2983233 RepID=UPI0023F78ABE|nr:glycosyltransferase [Bifidobacterium sp. ESL0790]WEV71904.1 glycosyltransferase [Bifidobacterium sp. ESL0790]
MPVFPQDTASGAAVTPLTIALVVDSLGNRGNGTANSALQYAAELERQGHHVRLVGVGSTRYPARIHHLPFVSWLAAKQQMQFAAPDEELFRRAFAGVDVVHIYMPFAFGRKALAVARSMGIPVTAGFHLQPENVTYSAGPLRFVPGLPAALYHLFHYWLYRHVAHIQAPSEMIADQLRAHGYREQLHVISNGYAPRFSPGAGLSGAAEADLSGALADGSFDGSADDSAESSAETSVDGSVNGCGDNSVNGSVNGSSDCFAESSAGVYADGSDSISADNAVNDSAAVALDVAQPLARPFRIVASGRLAREKDHETLIRAVALSRHARDIDLVICGTGPLQARLRRLARRELPRPAHIGFHANADMPNLLRKADLLVHPSIVDIESLSVLEGIACGLVPVIARSPLSAASQFALTDESLFPARDAKALAARIDWWIEHPRQRAEWSPRYAREARDKYSLPHCVREFVAMERAAITDS